MERLFVYGTLMEPKVQQEIFGRITTGTPDHLGGYRRSTIEIDDEIFPTLIPDQAGVVEGLVLDLTVEELTQADKYETEAYERVKVQLASKTETWAYRKRT